METFAWDDSFLLGLHEIDSHHRHLVELLCRAHREFLQATPDLRSTLQELERYADYHFSSEELWMMKGRYPDAAAHTREHRVFLTRVAELRKSFEGGRQHLSLELITFLEGWIVGHLLKMDRTLAEFILQ